MYVMMKILVSAIVIAIVTEVARRFPTYGGIIAALPLVSLLSIMWLYIQGEQHSTLSQFALGVLIGFPATAVLLVIVYLSLKQSLPFFVAIGFGLSSWVVVLLIQDFILKYFRFR